MIYHSWLIRPTIMPTGITTQVAGIFITRARSICLSESVFCETCGFRPGSLDYAIWIHLIVASIMKIIFGKHSFVFDILFWGGCFQAIVFGFSVWFLVKIIQRICVITVVNFIFPLKNVWFLISNRNQSQFC
jgi:hypothetical protein